MDDKISPELKLAMDADGYMPYGSLYLDITHPMIRGC